jgi:hypothetical protein
MPRPRRRASVTVPPSTPGDPSSSDRDAVRGATTIVIFYQDGVRYAVTVALECAPGQAPRLVLVGWGLPPLSPGQWAFVRERIDELWAETRIRCTCGHSWAEHADESPHGCGAHQLANPQIALPVAQLGRAIVDWCPCRIFSAAEPLFFPTCKEPLP